MERPARAEARAKTELGIASPELVGTDEGEVLEALIGRPAGTPAGRAQLDCLRRRGKSGVRMYWQSPNLSCILQDGL